MASSPQSGSLFSRLKRGRSKLDIKDGDTTASRISDADRSLDITPSKPSMSTNKPSMSSSKPPPSFSLNLPFANNSQSNLREDSGISKWLTSDRDASPSRPKDQLVPSTGESKLTKTETKDIPEKPSSSYSNAVSDAVNGMQKTSNKTQESSSISTLQSRIILEMKEKEQLMGRFEALSRVHMALQGEVDKERSRAEKAEAATKKKGAVDESRSNGAAVGAAGAAAGASTAAANAAAAKEAEQRLAKEKAAFDKERSDFSGEKTALEKERADITNKKAEIEKQQALLQEQKTAVERERGGIEQDRADMTKQKQAHATLLAEHEDKKSRETAQASETDAVRAKEKQAFESERSALENRLATTNTALTDSNNRLARLEEQNEQLKSSQSSAGPAQTTDAEFIEEMNKLSKDVENWVTNNFKKSRVDFEKLEKDPNSKELKLIKKAVPRYREAAEKAKLPFLQALVSARLMDEVWEDDFFAGMPGMVEEHKTEEEANRFGLGYLREAYKVLSASTSDDFNAWRASTVTLLRRTHDPQLTGHTNKLISRVAFQINNLLSSITSSSSETKGAALGSSPLPSRVRDLQAFISKTIDLARQFRAQKRVFEFRLPGSVESSDGLVRTVPFERDSMADILEEGQEGQRTIVAAIWPLVFKLGDEGRSRSVVVKARVLTEGAK